MSGRKCKVHTYRDANTCLTRHLLLSFLKDFANRPRPFGGLKNPTLQRKVSKVGVHVFHANVGRERDFLTLSSENHLDHDRSKIGRQMMPDYAPIVRARGEEK